MSEIEGYAAAARKMIEMGDDLRNQGFRGRDDMTLDARVFLGLLADAWEAGRAVGGGRELGHWEDDVPRKGVRTWIRDPNPYAPTRGSSGAN